MKILNATGCLSKQVVKAPSLNAFKNRLNKNWPKQDIVYEDYKCQISGSDVNPVDLTIGGEFGKEVFRHLVPEEDL